MAEKVARPGDGVRLRPVGSVTDGIAERKGSVFCRLDPTQERAPIGSDRPVWLNAGGAGGVREGLASKSLTEGKRNAYQHENQEGFHIQKVNFSATGMSRGGAAFTTWPNNLVSMSPFTAAGPKN